MMLSVFVSEYKRKWKEVIFQVENTWCTRCTRLNQRVYPQIVYANREHNCQQLRAIWTPHGDEMDFGVFQNEFSSNPDSVCGVS